VSEPASERRQRILVVDDESQIARVLRAGLSAQGYDVRAAFDGQSALEIFGEWMPDLVITDLSMPEMDGIELSRRIRERSSVPIILLSVTGDEHTKVRALDAGADDYVTKPFGMDELLARVRAALRRAPAIATETVIELGDFRIDIDARSVTVDGRAVRLTPKEFELMVYLARHPGKILTHRALLAAVWGGNYVEQVEYLRVFIGHLRKKIEPDPSNPRHILTEPWTGYRFEPGPE
jgi:two-component system KDP operon response regulator KdpE